MASIYHYYINGMDPVKARYPDNAVKRTFGKYAEAREISEGFFEVHENHEYYGDYLIGFMVRGTHPLPSNR